MQELNPLLHSQLRLAIMSVLLSAEEARLRVSEGEDGGYSWQPLSVQLDKRPTAGYIEKETDGSGSKPRTVCRMTEARQTGQCMKCGGS